MHVAWPVAHAVLDHIDQQLDRAPSELLVGDRECGHAWSHPLGERVVVERDDGDVVGDGEPGLVERLVGAERQPVVEADDRARSRVLPQQVVRRAPALRGQPVAAEVAGCGFEARGRQDLPDPGQPLDACHGVRRHVLRIWPGADEVDLAVPGVEEEACGGASGLDLVGDDGGGARGLFRKGVEQHRRHPVEQRRDCAGSGEHGREDDAVDLSVVHRLEQRALDLGIALGLSDEEHESVVPGGLDGALDHVARELRGGHRVGDQSERAGFAFAQPDRHDIRPVGEFGGGLSDAFLDALRDAQLVATPRKNQRCGRR